jgi:hypothetical protein
MIQGRLRVGMVFNMVPMKARAAGFVACVLLLQAGIGTGPAA